MIIFIKPHITLKYIGYIKVCTTMDVDSLKMFAAIFRRQTFLHNTHIMFRNNISKFRNNIFGRIGESGYYVLAKFNDEEKSELEITAFQVRSYQVTSRYSRLQVGLLQAESHSISEAIRSARLEIKAQVSLQEKD